MKKFLFSIAAAMMTVLSVNAQTMKIYKGDSLVATYSAAEADKVVFAEPEKEKVTIDLEIASKSHENVTVNVTPSDLGAHYFLMCEKKDYVSQFGSDDELMQGELDYWYAKYGAKYADYGYSSYNDLLLNGICESGKLEAREFGLLNAESDYVIYAFSIDDETLEPTSDLYKIEFTTEAKPASDWTLLGVGKYNEGIIKDLFGLDAKEIDVEIYQSNTDPTRYSMKNPYGPAMLYDWWYSSTVSMEQLIAAENNVWKETNFEFVINADNTVQFPMQEMGLYMSLSTPAFKGWPQFAGLTTGTYADGVITLVAKGGVIYLGSSGYYANSAGDFRITMPTTKEIAPAINAKASTAKTCTKVRNFVNVDLKAKANSTINAEVLAK